MKPKTAIIELAGNRTATVLTDPVGKETTELVEELRQAGDQDYRNTVIWPTLLKSDP